MLFIWHQLLKCVAYYLVTFVTLVTSVTSVASSTPRGSLSRHSLSLTALATQSSVWHYRGVAGRLWSLEGLKRSRSTPTRWCSEDRRLALCAGPRPEAEGLCGCINKKKLGYLVIAIYFLQ